MIDNVSSQQDIEFPQTDAAVETLSSGLEVILRKDTTAPVVSVQAWCRTGSIYEADLLGSGVSHLVEHMVFKGAGERDASRIAQDIQAEGGYINAYTSFDRTVYWVDAPAAGLKTAISVVADLSAKATFPVGEFEREKDVIRREIDMGKDDPGRESSRLLFSTVFRKHPYREPVIGHLDVFNSVSHEQMSEYYGKHYIPNNVFFVVVGDIDKDEALALIAEAYEGIDRQAYEPVILPDEPEQLGSRESHEFFDTQLTKLCLGWRIPALTHPDMPALDVLASVLGTGRSSRLYRQIRERERLVHSIGAYSYTPTHAGIFAISADLDPEKREKTQESVHRLLDDLIENGVTGEEVTKARRMTLSDQLDTLTTMRGQATDLGGNWLSTGNLDFTREYMASLASVSPEDVRAAAEKYLVDRTLTLTSLNPRSDVATIQAPATASRAGGVEKSVLGNGVTLVTKEDPRLPLVSVYANFRGGLLSETPETNGLCKLHIRTLIKGTVSRSAEEISAAIEEAGGSIGSSAGGSSLGVSIDVLKPDVGLATEILADILLNPTFPDEAVDREKEALAAAIKAQEDQLVQVAFRELRAALFPTIHPFHLPSTGSEESITKLSAAQLPEFHTEHVRGGNAVISVFGAIGTPDIREAFESAFASIPQGTKRETDPAVLEAQPEISQVEQDVVRDDKRQAVLTIGFPAPPLINDNRFALDLLDEACSDMASRVFIRIREELGLAYYVSSTQILGMAPGAFVFYLGTSPEQLELAEKELLSEIDKLANDGLTEDELRRAQKQMIGKQTIQNQSNAALSRQVALDELYGLGIHAHSEFSDRVMAVTRDDIVGAASGIFGSGQRAIIRVRP